MGDECHHECGFALLRLLKPLEYYEEKYGTSFFGLNRMFLLMEKQRNRGQDGCGIANVKLDVAPGTKYLACEKSVDKDPIKDVFERVQNMGSEKLKKAPKEKLLPIFNDASSQDGDSPEKEVRTRPDPVWVKENVPFAGECFLAHVRYGTDSENGLERCHPMLRESNWMTRSLLLAGNFNITNNEDLFASLVQIGQHPRELSDTVTLLEKIGHFVDKENNDLYVKYSATGRDPRTCFSLIAENINVARILRRASTDWDGGYCIAGLFGHGDAFCMRDPCGIRPAFYYCDDEVVVVASEAPLIQTVFSAPGELVHPLPPGSALIVKRSGDWKLESILPPGPLMQCSFERIYFSRGNDAGVYRQREHLGRLLLQPLMKRLESKGDSLANTVLSFIPNTSELAYNGLVKEAQAEMARRRESIIRELLQQQQKQGAEAGGVDFQEALRRVNLMVVRTEKVVHKDAKIRTFIQEDSSREHLTMHAYDVHYGTVAPKTDVLVVLDDSIVRGNTLKNAILRTLDRLGPKRIFVLSSCPQIRYTDVYGIDMAKLGDLCAFRAAISLLNERGLDHIITEVYTACRQEMSRPIASGEFTNHVKRIYEPFTPDEITTKIIEQLTPPDINCEVDILFNTVDALHEALPEHAGDWYFTGNFPTCGGTKVCCRAFVLWMEGSTSRCYGVTSADAVVRAPPVLVVGQGGAEHALAWKLSQSRNVGCVYVAPGNGGACRQQVHQQSHQRHTYSAPIHPVDVPLSPPHFREVKDFCREQGIALAVVGSTKLLQQGLGDALRSSEVKVFGPSKAASDIETPGFFAGFAQKLGLEVGTSGEFPEASVLAFSDGNSFTVFPAAVQNARRSLDGELGEETDGMGAFAPSPLVDADMLQKLEAEILTPIFDGLRKEGKAFAGSLQLDLALTPNGPRALALRCCMGNPVAQAVVPLIDGDLFDVVSACASGSLQAQRLVARAHTSVVAVVMASGGYPGNFKKGDPVSGIERALCVPGAHIFQTGTEVPGEDKMARRPSTPNHKAPLVQAIPKLSSLEGRVLTVAGRGPSLQEACERAYVAVRAISFKNARYRQDIGSASALATALKRASGKGGASPSDSSRPTLDHRGSGTFTALREWTYRSAGVDAEACDAAMMSFEPLVRRTWQKDGKEEKASTEEQATRTTMAQTTGVIGIGGGGSDSLLVSSTNVLGTKLRVARSAGKYDTLGVDLVALCTNDLAARGAKPAFFNEHFSTEKLDAHMAMQLVTGVSEGCVQADCKLLDTGVAELPGVFAQGGFDFVGFAVGVAERNALLPRKQDMRSGDVLIALPSTGLHSNGFSLVRAIIRAAGLDYSAAAPFDPTRSLGDALLESTRVYSKSVLALANAGLLHGATQVTRGGLKNCLEATIPSYLAAQMRADAWELPAVFRWLATVGKLPCSELMSTFNCGIGMLLIVPAAKQEQALSMLHDMHEEPTVVGNLVVCTPGSPRMDVEGATATWLMLPELGVSLPFPEILSSLQDHCTMPLKRVLVLAGAEEETPVVPILNAAAQPSSSAAVVAVVSPFRNCAALLAAKCQGVTEIVLGDGKFEKVEFSVDLGDSSGSEEVPETNLGVEFCSLLQKEMEAHKAEMLLILDDIDCTLFTKEFLTRHLGKALKVQASLLPAFPGPTPIEAAISSGTCITGCSVCFAAPPNCLGPIVVQEPIRILPNETAGPLRSRLIADCESRAVPQALQVVASGQAVLDSREDGTMGMTRSASFGMELETMCS